MDVALIINLVIGLFVIIIAISGIKQVSQSQAAIIERLGKYNKTLEPGLNFIVPFLDRQKNIGSVNLVSTGIASTRIDLREQMLDISEKSIITKDNIRMSVDTLVFYQIVEPFKCVYEISNPVMAIRQLSFTTIRNIFGEMELDKTLAARESINEKLRQILDEATDKWGIKVLRVEIQDIIPPEELKDAMQQQMIAERDRRAKVTNAEAYKQEKILLAEGVKQKAILEAEGEAKSVSLRAEAEKNKRILEAKGEAEAIKLVQLATAEGLDAVRDVVSNTKGIDVIIKLEALKSQQDIANSLANGKSSKIFLPNEIAGFFGAIGGISDMLKDTEIDTKK